MHDSSTILSARKSFSEKQIKKFGIRLDTYKSLRELKNLCIYTTGSYGRLEASKFSDIDLFFLEDSVNDQKVSRIQETLINADVIRLARELGYPEFSGDGKYLKVLQLEDILDNLGGQNEDYENYFTARLLLLLESKPIWNEEIHHRIIEKIVKSYYRDYERHEKDFQPTFIINDIIRFWKTLCLNYEHKRNKIIPNESEQNKHHIKNLKLKFSRMMTCFSAIVWLAATQEKLNEERVVRMVKLTPLERLQEVENNFPKDEQIVQHLKKIVSEYEWFLEKMNVPNDNSREWISNKENRENSYQRGREFGDEIYFLLQAVSKNKNFLRYVVV